MLRQSLVIGLATLLSILISRFSGDWHPIEPGGIFHYFGPTELMPWYMKFAGLIGISRLLIPGFLIGALLASRQVTIGALTAVLAMVATEFLIDLHFGYAFPTAGQAFHSSISQWPMQSLLVSVIVYGAFGATGAALGRALPSSKKLNTRTPEGKSL